MADDVETGGGLDIADLNEDLDEIEEEDEDQEEVDDGKRELAKESRALKFLLTHHPECRLDYQETVLSKLPLQSYPPTSELDKHHKSVPYLTIFEKTKLIGFRANQLAQGARPLVEPPAHVTDVLEIARIELEQKRLPFILKRPMPDGTYEYWRLSDLIVV
jgi:DNA-directed RNA polymerases I, II, and III subunit RPABC2